MDYNFWRGFGEDSIIISKPMYSIFTECIICSSCNKTLDIGPCCSDLHLPEYNTYRQIKVWYISTAYP